MATVLEMTCYVNEIKVNAIQTGKYVTVSRFKKGNLVEIDIPIRERQQNVDVQGKEYTVIIKGTMLFIWIFRDQMPPFTKKVISETHNLCIKG